MNHKQWRLKNPDRIKHYNEKNRQYKLDWAKKKRLKVKIAKLPTRYMKCDKCNTMLYSRNNKFKGILKKHFEDVHSYGE